MIINEAQTTTEHRTDGKTTSTQYSSIAKTAAATGASAAGEQWQQHDNAVHITCHAYIYTYILYDTM